MSLSIFYSLGTIVLQNFNLALMHGFHVIATFLRDRINSLVSQAGPIDTAITGFDASWLKRADCLQYIAYLVI